MKFYSFRHFICHFIVFFLLLHTPSWGGYEKGNAVTYSFSGGRLGDNLICYLHAKWISYKHGLPLVYVPFPEAENFHLKENASLLSQSNFKNRLTIGHENQIYSRPNSMLFVVSYFAECEFDRMKSRFQFPLYFKVDWEDPYFREEIRQCLTPTKPVETLVPPKNCISLAIHVRRGGGFDVPETKFYYPLKFPPDNYYIKQITKITEIFENQPIYAFIFTDDPNPGAIAEKYQAALNNPNITFDYRKKQNGHDKNVIEDLLSMSQFDCLIRSQSTFSFIASLLTEYKVMISPAHAFVKRKSNYIVIDKVDIQIKNL